MRTHFFSEENNVANWTMKPDVLSYLSCIICLVISEDRV